jgi:hypothetical protein
MLALLLDSFLKLLHGGCAVRVASGQLKSKAIVLVPRSFIIVGKDTRWMRLEVRPPEDQARASTSTICRGLDASQAL